MAPRTHTLKLSPSNQFFGFSQPRLSRRVWKTSCLVKRWMSCNCWRNLSCNLLICFFKLVEKAPLGQCWISLQEYWLEFHWSGTVWRNQGHRSAANASLAHPGFRRFSWGLIQRQKGESGTLDQSGPVGAFLRWNWFREHQQYEQFEPSQWGQQLPRQQ